MSDQTSENAAIIQSGADTITSRRVAWQDATGRDVWVWRTDGDEPLTFPSVAAATQWRDEVLIGSTVKEREEWPWVIVPLGVEEG